MIEFEKLDIQNLEDEFEIIGQHQCENPKLKYYFISAKKYLIIHSVRNHTYPNGEDTQILYQIEIPKAALQYYIDTIGHFFLHEDEGGIPHGKMSVVGTINGEHIQVFRAHSADQYGGGYSITTIDRTIEGVAKEFIFSDHELFKRGLMDVLKELVEKI